MAVEQSKDSANSPPVAAVGPNEKLFATLYSELRDLAQRQLRRNENVAISPTTLLHEAYLGMSGAMQSFRIVPASWAMRPASCVA